MGRRPIGKKGEKVVAVQMLWPESTLKRIERVRGCQERASFVREAVERELRLREVLLRDQPEA